mmetsp:Transcript_22493/g.58547  ORF Transcript_22493/g.58547 Transcript_22493/m.58547 type:complete len:243 (+) Transcript_22493:389-1117(+)
MHCANNCCWRCFACNEAWASKAPGASPAFFLAFARFLGGGLCFCSSASRFLAVAAACAMAATSNKPWALSCCMTAIQSKASSILCNFVEPSSSRKRAFSIPLTDTSDGNPTLLSPDVSKRHAHINRGPATNISRALQAYTTLMAENDFASKFSETHASCSFAACTTARAFAVSSEPSRAFDASSWAFWTLTCLALASNCFNLQHLARIISANAPIDLVSSNSCSRPVIRWVLAVTAVPNATL